MAGPRLIEVGRVAGAFGVRGEVRITAYTEDPLALAGFAELRRQDGSHALTIVSARGEKGAIVGRAREIATKEEADALRGLRLYVPREAFPEPDEDEFYLTDLIGLRVQSKDDANSLGTVKSVQNFGAGDMLEIEPEGGGVTWYLPFTRETVPEVRIADGVVLADPPEETE